MSTKLECLCKIREIHRAICELESGLEHLHGVSLNEGMLLCTLSAEGTLSSGEIAEKMGLTNSNTSKVIKSVESKGFVRRMLGECDKRQMYFELTDEGRQKLIDINMCRSEIPEDILKLI